MENNAGGKNEALSPQEESAKAAILAECDKLAQAGVTFVAVHFDGYGDDGATEEVKCFNSEWYAYAEHKPVGHDASRLQEKLRSAGLSWLRERLRRVRGCSARCGSAQGDG